MFQLQFNFYTEYISISLPISRKSLFFYRNVHNIYVCVQKFFNFLRNLGDSNKSNLTSKLNYKVNITVHSCRTICTRTKQYNTAYGIINLQ